MNVCTNCKKELTNSELCVECQCEYDEFAQYLHEEEMREEQYYQVTREMAIGAGDRSLEGHWIKW
jgi:hypothetical protein